MTEQPAELPEEQVVLTLPIPLGLHDMIRNMDAAERFPGVWRLRFTFHNGRGASVVTGTVGVLRSVLGFEPRDLVLGEEYEVAPLNSAGEVDVDLDKSLGIDHMNTVYDIDGVVTVLEKIADLAPESWTPCLN